MTLKTAAFAVAAALTAPAAVGQVLIVGDGYARDCYEAAEIRRSASKGAIDACTSALNLQFLDRGERAGTHVNRGVLLMRAGQFEDAMADYESALKLEPDLGEAFLNRGAALIYLKDFGAALPELDRAIELDSRDLFAAHYNRAIARENTGDIQGAFEDFNRALELKPGWDLAQTQLQRFRLVEP